MKKIGIALLCVFLAAGIFISCEKKSETEKFIMGLDDSFPPMGFRNENQEIVGYDVDLAKEVAKRLGLELVLQPINWAAKEQELNTKQIDCIWNGFTITEERKKNVLYTPPYIRNAQVVVVRANSPIKTLADLAGKSIGTQGGSSSIEAIDGNPAFKASVKAVIEYDDFLKALLDLEVGGIDAVVIDLLLAKDNIARFGRDFRILNEDLGDEEMGIGFRLDDTELRDKVWGALLEMAEDGTVANISMEWFGDDISIIGK